MNLTRYVDDLQHHLINAAEAGGTEAREIAERLISSIDAAVRLVLLDALSNAAGEISADLAPGSVDVRLRSGDPEFVVTVPQPDSAHAGGRVPTPATAGPSVAPSPVASDEGRTARTTLRLPDHLKTRVETAAARDGVSVNTWLVRTVAAALEPGAELSVRTEQRGGKRIIGWVR
ncbi:MAG: histidine kinase [Deltaproteobacteria bacterium]|nr:histidine kinase [Deltaproteobacteria bacterium]